MATLLNLKYYVTSFTTLSLGLHHKWLVINLLSDTFLILQDQDPVAMGSQVVATAKKTLKIRYCFLPYLYTLFYRSHVFGDTVARPLFFE